MLDNVLSGLDNHTERVVFNRIFGPNGYLRRMNAAAILVSNLPRQLEQADAIYELGHDGMLLHKPYGNVAVHLQGDQGAPEEAESSDDYNTNVKKNHAFGATALPRKNNAEEMKSRQIGDKSVYKYYAQSTGFVSCAIFLVSISTVVFFMKFPRKLRNKTNLSRKTSPNLEIFLRNLDENVGCIKRCEPQPRPWKVARRFRNFGRWRAVQSLALVLVTRFEQRCSLDVH